VKAAIKVPIRWATVTLISKRAPVPLPTTKTDAESEVHTGLVHMDAASFADIELSKDPKLLPNTEINVAPRTGPLVNDMDDADGASYSNAQVLKHACKPTESTIDPVRVRPEDDLLKITDDESQRDASAVEPANFEKVVASDVDKPRPSTETNTAPLIGKLLQFEHAETILMAEGAVYECINGDMPYIEPTDTASLTAESLPAGTFPARDEDDIQTDTSTAVIPNVIQLVA
jgi:hypothetical protein